MSFFTNHFNSPIHRSSAALTSRAHVTFARCPAPAITTSARAFATGKTRSSSPCTARTGASNSSTPGQANNACIPQCTKSTETSARIESSNFACSAVFTPKIHRATPGRCRPHPNANGGTKRSNAPPTRNSNRTARGDRQDAIRKTARGRRCFAISNATIPPNETPRQGKKRLTRIDLATHPQSIIRQ